MWVLNKEKENLLISKYNFEKKKDINAYGYGRSITIWSSNHEKWSGLVNVMSLSKATQDKIYELIKDDVIVLGSNINKEQKIKKYKKEIEELQDKIRKLEEIK